MEEDHFCSGPGRVMQGGFMSSVNGTCILYLFPGAVMDTPVKYGFGLLGTFLLAFLNEAFVFCRKRLLQTESLATKHALRNGLETILYGAQMVVAYWLMLLVMTYESGLFGMIIGGLVCGHFTFNMLNSSLSKRKSELPLLAEQSTVAGTPCCGGAQLD